MTREEIVRYVASEDRTTNEKCIYLRRVRAIMLNEIHEKQQLLDQVDYMLYELKNMKENFPNI